MHAGFTKIWIRKPGSKRLFLAIPMNAKWKEAFGKVQQGLQEGRVIGNVRTNWTPPENMHITVRFIGVIDEQCIPGLIPVLSEAAGKTDAFILTRMNLEFATPSEPKMIWAKFSDSTEFQSTVSRFTKSIARYLHESCNGMTIHNGHDVIPHVTLARMKGEIRTGTTLTSDVVTPLAFNVRTLVLYASETLPTGSRYTKLASFRLRSRREK